MRHGWTLQEQILSTRVLMFGAKEFGWDCQKCQEHESGHHLASFYPLQHTKEIRRANDTVDKPDLNWRYIVMLYSRRSLTNPADKLPAMSGLASTLR